MKQLYKQKCPHCTHEWMGKIPHPVSCTRCKRRLDMPTISVPGRSVAIRFVEENLIRAGVHPHVAHAEAKRKLNSIIGFGGSK